MPVNPTQIRKNIASLVNKPQDNRISLEDTRKIDAATGKALTDKNRMSVRVNPELAKEIISKAKKNGIDPYLALAMAHQESSFGTEPGLESNPFHISLTKDGTIKLSDISEKGSVQVFMDLFKKKIEMAKKMGKEGDVFAAQAWNGFGTIANRGMYYGVDTNKTPINFSQDPKYGKRVIDIRDNIIRKNPQLVKLIQDTK